MKLTKMRLSSLVVAGAFVAGGLGVFGYLLSGTGFRYPFQPEPYTVVVNIEDADNLVPVGRVQMAGVGIGKVADVIIEQQHVRAVLRLEDNGAPLHEGATVRMGERSAVGETYLDVKDGTGPEIPSGSTLPDTAVMPSTQLHDFIRGVDQPTKQAMSGLFKSLGDGTTDTRTEVAATFTGLGHLGRQGHTALDAIAAQSENLRKLTGQVDTLMRTLDTGEGQIATLVSNADRLTSATARQRPAIEDTMRQLPGVLDTAKSATAKVDELAGSLAPVASGLREAAPFLNTALTKLPDTSKDLRESMGPLGDTFDSAPRTLDQIPEFGSDVRDLTPDLRDLMRETNPMFDYLRPYGKDVASLIANFNASMGYTDENGYVYLRLIPAINERSLQSPADFGPLTYKNPFPPARKGGEAGPFKGPYPRVERAPR